MLGDVLARIDARLAALHLSESAAAQKAGLSKDAIRNIRRAVRDGKTQAGVSTRTLNALAPVLETTVVWLLTGKTEELTMSRHISGEIYVVGTVAAGVPVEVDGDHAFDKDITVPSVSSYPTEWQIAFMVSGNSINKVAEPGEILVCLDLAKAGAEWAHDDIVIVERRLYDGQAFERTAKRARQTSRGWEFWPDSDDPKCQEPLTYESPADHEEIRIVAKVIWIVRRP